MRKENDLIGEVNIEDEFYYGVNTKRALNNFNISNKKVNKSLIKAFGYCKKAASQSNVKLNLIDDKKANVIIKACDELINGDLNNHIVVDAFQGGAGTSLNMNVNEVIANRALELLGESRGDYNIIHPLDDVNKSQSTNDIYPTALKIATIWGIRILSEKLADLQSAFQEKENEFYSILKIGRTQLQDAVPISLGQEFGAWAQAIARDRWRVYKMEERLRQINIGGTAIGTGINADVKYIYLVTEELRQLTGIGLARGENLVDITQNNDVFVEVSGLLKTVAVNLTKIANDIRLLSSGPRAGFGEIILPTVQAGSTIMPGKVNPVIPEVVNLVSFQVIANDLAITLATSAGQLELNAFLPLISINLLDSLDILENVITTFINNCIVGIKPNIEKCKENLIKSLALLTPISKIIGYDNASKLAKRCIEEDLNLEELLLSENVLNLKQIDEIKSSLKSTAPNLF